MSDKKVPTAMELVARRLPRLGKKLTNEEIGTLRRAAEIVERMAKRNGPGYQPQEAMARELREIARNGQRREST